MGAAVGIQCLCLNDWSEHDHAVWGSRRLCDLARSVDRLAPRSVAVRSPLLGKAGFCERCFMPSLSDFSSVSLIFCYFCFILPRFSSLSWAHHPLLSRFCLLTRRLALQQARCAIRGRVNRREVKQVYNKYKPKKRHLPPSQPFEPHEQFLDFVVVLVSLTSLATAEGGT